MIKLAGKISIILILSISVFAQEEDEILDKLTKDIKNDTLFYTNALGSIFKSTTPNKGRLHVLGNVALTNADYTRGAFDGVPEELSSIAVSVNLATVMQVYKSNGLLNYLNLIIGTQQGLSNNEFESEYLSWWYESNYFAGLVFALKDNLTMAVSYLTATSPNLGTIGNEIDFAVSYYKSNFIGLWEPSLEVTVPLNEQKGVLLQAGLNPSLTINNKGQYPIGILFPVRFGAALLEYYLPDNDFTGFFSIGISMQMISKNIPDSFGKWNVFAGADFIIRDNELEKLDKPADTGGNFIITGKIGFGFIY